MYKIFGVPLIKHVIDRVQRSKNVKQIVVSTSKKKSDEHSNFQFIMVDVNNNPIDINNYKENLERQTIIKAMIECNGVYFINSK